MDCLAPATDAGLHVLRTAHAKYLSTITLPPALILYCETLIVLSNLVQIETPLLISGNEGQAVPGDQILALQVSSRDRNQRLDARGSISHREAPIVNVQP